MRTVFFGTPLWAVPSLDALLESEIEVAAVVTNPDRPAGRGMKLAASPVKLRAMEEKVTVLQPESARDPALHDLIGHLTLDFATVVAYGKILPAGLLELPRLGFVNVHFSLLPAYRGAAPVQRAMLDGVGKTGVSIMILTEGMDEGPVLARSELETGDRETAGEVGERLSRAGAELLVPSIRGYAEGEISPEPQDDDAATYAPKIRTEEARIDWDSDAQAIDRFVRALNPAPGAWTTWRGGRLKVHALRALPPKEHTGLGPGEVSADGTLVVGTSSSPVELIEVQAAGKKRMTGAELARGLRATPGERMGA